MWHQARFRRPAWLRISNTLPKSEPIVTGKRRLGSREFVKWERLWWLRCWRGDGDRLNFRVGERIGQRPLDGSLCVPYIERGSGRPAVRNFEPSSGKYGPVIRDAERIETCSTSTPSCSWRS